MQVPEQRATGLTVVISSEYPFFYGVFYLDSVCLLLLYFNSTEQILLLFMQKRGCCLEVMMYWQLQLLMTEIAN